MAFAPKNSKNHDLIAASGVLWPFSVHLLVRDVRQYFTVTDWLDRLYFAVCNAWNQPYCQPDPHCWFVLEAPSTWRINLKRFCNLNGIFANNWAHIYPSGHQNMLAPSKLEGIYIAPNICMQVELRKERLVRALSNEKHIHLVTSTKSAQERVSCYNWINSNSI